MLQRGSTMAHLDLAFNNPRGLFGTDWCRFVEVNLRLSSDFSPRRSCVYVFAVFLSLSACRSWSPDSLPAISFSKVSRADAGGPKKTDTIEGRASGVRPGQQIVLYARSQGVWWVQPFTNHPYTKIQDDSKWKNQTHLGSEYAALLVEPGYTPSDTADTLPAMGAGVVAVAVVKGVGPAPPPPPIKTVHFSGYDWTVTHAATFRGGTGFEYIPENAWTEISSPTVQPMQCALLKAPSIAAMM
jgi:hypothetical protein